MKHPTFRTIFYLLGIGLFFLSFAQITNDHSLSKANDKYNFSLDTLITQIKQHSVTLRDDEWRVNNRKSYERDANNNSTLILYQEWKITNWINDRQDINEYDENDNLTLRLTQKWDGTIWRNNYKYIYEYDANDNQTLNLHQYWDDAEWINDSRALLYYGIIGSNSNLELPDFSFRVFPNPSNSRLKIDLGKIDFQNGHVNIYNSIGRLVYSQAIQNGINRKSLDLSGLAEGTYHIQILAGDRQATQTFTYGSLT